MAVADLNDADYNPRTITEAALRGLGASLERFGLVQPIVWNERTGNVVAGHQRLRVLRAEGVERTTVVVVDYSESEERAGFVWWECLTPADKRLVKPTKVVLTIAHLDQQPEHNDPSNLRALCQRCHLTYDATWRRMAAENGKPPTVAECIERWADLYGRGGV